MKYKRLVCAVFALMLVGASVVSTGTVFADEPAEIEGAGEVVNTEEPEVAAPEVKGEEVPETPAAGEEAKKEEITEPAGTAKATLRAAPVLAANNEVLRDGEGGEAGEEEVVVYDAAMGLETKSFNLLNDTQSNHNQCGTITPSDGLACRITSRGRVEFTATKPGAYDVVLRHRSRSSTAWNSPFVTERTVKVAVYNLEVTSEQVYGVLKAGTEFTYEYANTFGDVEVTATRNGEEIEVADGVVGTSEEGSYAVTFTNASARAAGINQSVTIRFTVYSISAAEPMTDGDNYGAAAGTLQTLWEEFVNTFGEEATEDDWNAFVAHMETAFGDDEEGEATAFGFIASVFEGGKITTGADYEEIDEADVSEELVAKVAEFGADKVSYYDIWVWIEATFGEDAVYLGDLHELDGKITVAVMDTETPDGYERTFYVVREHNGEIEVLVEGVDYYVENGKLYIYADKFSTYAVAYKDTLIPVTYTLKAPETGEATEAIEVEGGASASLSMAVVTVMAAVTLAGAAVIAKRK